jgi:hypothetical protein
MPEPLSKEDIAKAVAEGKNLYDADKFIGLLVALGLLCLWLGLYNTIPFGLALLALAIWSRNQS